MPRKAKSITNNQDLKRLSSLIRTAIDKTGKTDSEIADTAEITRSHLSYILKGEKSLSPEKIKKLSDVLNLSEQELLEAAGYIESLSIIDKVLSTIKKTESVTVITDPRFLDSAIFLWLFNSQFLKSFGIDWKFQLTSWSTVPIRIDSTEKSIGFYNRKSQVIFRDKIVALPEYWADLCVYKGYALIVRKKDATGISDNPNLDEAKKYLQKLKKKHVSPVIITMASGTVDQLKTPFTNDIGWDDFRVETYSNPDEALNLFLSGLGDLFIGGLPQRFAAERRGDCLALISTQNNPWLFSVNSLVCSKDMFQDEKVILSLVTSVWFEVCNQLRMDVTFRKEMVGELDDMLKRKFNVSRHFITEELINEVFENQAEDKNIYEFFPRRPAGVVSQVIRILNECVAKSIELKINDIEIKDAIEWISVNKIDSRLASLTK